MKYYTLSKNSNSMKLSKKQGFTILEVTVAVLILTITTASIMQGLHTGDKIFWKSSKLDKASVLAQNEVERIKSEAPVSENIEELEFEKEIDNTKFFIRRKIIEDDSIISQFSSYPIKAIEIQVWEYDDNEEYYGDSIKPLVRFRFLQGYGIR
jgi:prepilin-type N-terminal cleavage/methylation domain-containing protein